MTAKDILSRLKDGNARFTKDKLDGKLQNSSRRSALTEAFLFEAAIAGVI